jgi:flagellar basal-body rod protein FlgC
MSEPVSLQVFDVTASALTAERRRLSVISQNIANAEVSGTAANPPPRRQRVLFESVLKDELGRRGGPVAGSIQARVGDAPGDFRRVHIEGHPLADSQGMVLFPNINVVDEMVDLVDASRTYEANLAALRTWRQMLRQTLDMAR